MTITEGLSQIKILLAGQTPEPAAGNDPAPEPNQLTFETYDLKDGSKIDMSALKVGADAMLFDQTGNLVAAPNGDYELVDGTMVTVEDGKVSEIKSLENEPQITEEIAAKFKEIDDLGIFIEVLKAENQELKTKLGMIEGKFTDAFSQVFVLIEDLAKMPSQDPIKKPTNTFKVLDSKAEKVERFMQKFIK